MPIVLGIETSCDETSASVIEGHGDDVSLRSLVILSQDVHRVFGGVVPEIASRAHLAAVHPVVQRALSEANLDVGALDAIAVTHAPGLVGALLVGVSYAKGMAWESGKALLGIHHMEGHLFATSLDDASAVPPFTALLVSGGHTLLVDVEKWGEYQLLGATRDDAAGEAFDKVAKLLGLPYPGGRHIERIAHDGEEDRFRFARPMLRRDQRLGDPDYFDVSFSGLKTAVLHAVQKSDDVERDAPHLARAFQEALIDTLVEKTYRAARAFKRSRVVLGGGVACNQALVGAMARRFSNVGTRVFAPSPRLATDNAAMIARAGLFRLEGGERADWSLNAFSTLALPGLAAHGVAPAASA